MASVWVLVDRGLPAPLRDATPAERRLARLAVVFACCLFVWAPVYALIFWMLGAAELALWVCIAGAVVGASPLTLRWTLRPDFAAHQVLVGLAVLLFAIAIHTGGLFSAAVPWFPALPLMAMALLGFRGAALWTGVALVNVSVFGAAAVFGFEFPRVLVGTAANVNAATTFPGLTLFVFSIAASFEFAKNQMAAELAEQRSAVEAARDAARSILDVVDQGLFVVDAAGRVKAEASTKATTWFGHPQGAYLWDWIGSGDQTVVAAFDVCHAALRDDLMPVEVVLAQMPREIRSAGRVLRFQWQKLAHGELLVVVTDATATDAAERAERAQRELVEAVQLLAADRVGFFEFLDEARALVASIEGGEGGATTTRAIHTLKGNASLFKLTSISAACHELESKIADDGGLSEIDRQGFGRQWRALEFVLAPFVDGRGRNIIEVERAEVAAALAATTERELRRRVGRWLLEPVRRRLERAATQTQALARRLGKEPLQIVVDDGGVLLEPLAWAPFWSAFVHALRNAVGHGIEDSDERLALGKVPRGTLTLSARTDGRHIAIGVNDDGRGIDWEQIANKARAAGHPATTEHELVDALFADGVSTAAEVTDVSGRGVGMSALRDAVARLNGSIDVRSKKGQGTMLEFRFPSPGERGTEAVRRVS